MSIRKVLANSIWFGIVPKLATLVNVLILPIITPFLTAYDYGIWGIISAYVSIIISVSTLGLNFHLTNSFYEYKNKYTLLWGRILYLLLIGSVLCSVILFACLMVALSEIPTLKRFYVVLLCVFPVLFSANSLIANHIFVLKNTPKPLVLRLLLASFAGILILFISVYYLKLGYIGFVLNAAISSVISFGLFIKPLWLKERIYPIVETNIERVKHLLKLSYPIIPHTLGLMLLSSSSRIVLSIYNISIDEIGLFTNGYMIGDYIIIITAAISTALTPQIQEAYRTCNYLRYRILYYFCQIMALSLIFLFAIWMPEIYKLLIRNEQLQEAGYIASYICFANAVYPFYVFVSTIIFIKKDTKKILYLVFIPGVLNILICLLFVPLFGYKVAIFSSMIAYWSQILIPLFSKYFARITSEWFGNVNKLLYFVLILVCVVMISKLIAELNVELKMIFSLIFVIGVYCFMRKKNFLNI